MGGRPGVVPCLLAARGAGSQAARAGCKQGLGIGLRGAAPLRRIEEGGGAVAVAAERASRRVGESTAYECVRPACLHVFGV